MSLGWPFNIIYSCVIWYNFAVAKNDRSWAPDNDVIVTSSVKFWELMNKIASLSSVSSFRKGFAASVQEIIAAIFIFAALRLEDRFLFRLYQSIMINLSPSSSYILDFSCSIAPAHETNQSLIMVTGWYANIHARRIIKPQIEIWFLSRPKKCRFEVIAKRDLDISINSITKTL